MAHWGGLVCVAVALAGCYEPPDACGLACTTSCPDGFTCADHVCKPSDGTTCGGPALAFTAIQAGSRHACALDPEGALYCWGANDASQLGLPPSAPVASPTRIGSDTFTGLSAGGDHTCALSAGKPWCWGWNEHGQAAGTRGGLVMAPSAVYFGPTPEPPATFDVVSAGSRASCAIGGGELWCWGESVSIGYAGPDVTRATRIGTKADWTAVSIGDDHGCGIEAGTIVCWGSNEHGQSGQPTTMTNVPAAMPISQPPAGLVPITVVTGHKLSCAIFAAPMAAQGQLWCWGENDAGQLDNTGQDSAVPKQIGGEDTWTAVSPGHARVCGIRDGNGYCWGREYDGGLGDGIWQKFTSTFADSTSLGPMSAIDLSLESQQPNVPDDEFTCALSGTMPECFGENSHGELGLGSVSLHQAPIALAGAWTHVWSGQQHVCATDADGKLWCWGADYEGQVTAGQGFGRDQPCAPGLPCNETRPVLAPVTSPVDTIAIGYDYTCAHTGTEIRCWGSNQTGLLGVDNPSGHTMVSPAPPITGQTWTSVTGGDRGTCGVTESGQLACWGSISGTQRNVPTALVDTEIHDISEIHFGDDVGCATRKSDSSRVCWGANGSDFRLGNGSLASVATPTVFDAGSIAKAIVRGNFGCAITTNGGVECWGRTDLGQAGQPGSQQTVSMPAVVSDPSGALTGCTGLALGDDNACAVCSGRVECWGSNYAAELGRGTIATQDEIAQAIDVSPMVAFTEVAVRNDGACALATDHTLWCWGDSTYGAIGDGGSSRNLPTPVGTTP